MITDNKIIGKSYAYGKIHIFLTETTLFPWVFNIYLCWEVGRGIIAVSEEHKPYRFFCLECSHKMKIALDTFALPPNFYPASIN